MRLVTRPRHPDYAQRMRLALGLSALLFAGLCAVGASQIHMQEVSWVWGVLVAFLAASLSTLPIVAGAESWGEKAVNLSPGWVGSHVLSEGDKLVLHGGWDSPITLVANGHAGGLGTFDTAEEARAVAQRVAEATGASIVDAIQLSENPESARKVLLRHRFERDGIISAREYPDLHGEAAEPADARHGLQSLEVGSLVLDANTVRDGDVEVALAEVLHVGVRVVRAEGENGLSYAVGVRLYRLEGSVDVGQRHVLVMQMRGRVELAANVQWLAEQIQQAVDRVKPPGPEAGREHIPVELRALTSAGKAPS